MAALPWPCISPQLVQVACYPPPTAPLVAHLSPPWRWVGIYGAFRASLGFGLCGNLGLQRFAGWAQDRVTLILAVWFSNITRRNFPFLNHNYAPCGGVGMWGFDCRMRGIEVGSAAFDTNVHGSRLAVATPNCVLHAHELLAP